MNRKQLPGINIIRYARQRIHQKGGVIAYATESCFGLGCNPKNAMALRRIIRLKHRPSNKGLIVIAANLQQLNPYIQPLSEEQLKQIKQYWPGPYTLLLSASNKVLPLLRGTGNKNIAVRITAEPQTAGLCIALNSALVSTSANKTGRLATKTYRSCYRQFSRHVLTLPGRSGKHKKPSTIIDPVTGEKLR